MYILLVENSMLRYNNTFLYLVQILIWRESGMARVMFYAKRVKKIFDIEKVKKKRRVQGSYSVITRPSVSL